eukprot:TRINITY_DN9558_c0_g1_i3.p1 TRINITY_DN9558_c0_g1~~TRINITY_DN9558_c0_g1_i3.p1  ORF type:complete len:221 (-),score=70.24 TRINITY_DN9558_c0_g1_i3:113-676(-)
MGRRTAAIISARGYSPRPLPTVQVIQEDPLTSMRRMAAEISSAQRSRAGTPTSRANIFSGSARKVGFSPMLSVNRRPASVGKREPDVRPFILGASSVSGKKSAASRTSSIFERKSRKSSVSPIRSALRSPRQGESIFSRSRAIFKPGRLEEKRETRKNIFQERKRAGDEIFRPTGLSLSMLGQFRGR